MSNQRDLIDEEWCKFARQVLPPDASTIQRWEMRRAFYGGVWAALMAIRADGDGVRGKLERDCVAFKERVVQGQA